MRNPLLFLAASALLLAAGCGGGDSAADETVVTDLGADPVYEPSEAAPAEPADPGVTDPANVVEAQPVANAAGETEAAGNAQQQEAAD